MEHSTTIALRSSDLSEKQWCSGKSRITERYRHGERAAYNGVWGHWVIFVNGLGQSPQWESRGRAPGQGVRGRSYSAIVDRNYHKPIEGLSSGNMKLHRVQEKKVPLVFLL